MICDQDAVAIARPSGAMDPDMLALLADASTGSIEAQREMRNAAMSVCWNPGHLAPDLELYAAMGVLLARMAAAHGDMMDVRELVDMLLRAAVIYEDRGHLPLSNQCLVEAIALYERIALTGAEDAAIAVQRLVEGLPPEVIAAAREHNIRVAEKAVPPGSIARH